MSNVHKNCGGEVVRYFGLQRTKDGKMMHKICNKCGEEFGMYEEVEHVRNKSFWDSFVDRLKGI